MPLYYNIKGVSVAGGQETTELIAPNTDNINIRSLLLTNIHDTSEATVTIFIQDNPTSAAPKTYNIIHTVAIPADTSLLLDSVEMLYFDIKYGLYITVGSSDTVDVIIST